MATTKLSIQSAKRRVEKFILEHLSNRTNEQVKIYTWDSKRNTKLIGIRVAEVSVVQVRSKGGLSGYSWMQVDLPYGLAVCAQAERLMLAYLEKWPDDELAEEEWRMAFAMKGGD